MSAVILKLVHLSTFWYIIYTLEQYPAVHYALLVGGLLLPL